MKLDNLKELLLIKSSSNDMLNSFIFHMKDDYLVHYVQESLEKMSRSGQGNSPNSKVINFAKELSKCPLLPAMIYDNVSHHATRYASALKANDQGLADKHMSRIFRTLHLIKKMHDGGAAHSKGVEEGTGIHNDKDIGNSHWVDMKPWERTHYHRRAKNPKSENPWNQGHYERDTIGEALSQHHNHSYKFLQNAPHFTYHKEIGTHGHDKAWPLEETVINGRYVHVDPNHQYNGKFELHPFDLHPIIRSDVSGQKTIMHTKAGDFAVDPRISEKYENDLINWKNDHFSSYIPMDEIDPDIGKTKSPKVHKDVEPLPYKDINAKRQGLGEAEDEQAPHIKSALSNPYLPKDIKELLVGKKSSPKSSKQVISGSSNFEDLPKDLQDLLVQARADNTKSSASAEIADKQQPQQVASRYEEPSDIQDQYRDDYEEELAPLEEQPTQQAIPRSSEPAPDFLENPELAEDWLQFGARDPKSR